MTRKEAENYIYESYLKAEKMWDYSLPDEKKRHPEFSKPVIDALVEKRPVPTLTITGSKGKGSVGAMISQILSAFLKVGVMTSPHIETFNERFRINGNPISDEEFCRYAKKTKELFANREAMLKEGECISPMGIQCAIALQYFCDKQTEFNIFEGGKGVRYDDVNNIFHEYGVINRIFLEHTRELGETLEEITKDKACLITGEQKCVYVSEQTKEVNKVLQKRALEKKVVLKQYGKDFRAENIQYKTKGMIFDAVMENCRIKNVFLPLLGVHQVENCVLALAFCMDYLGDDFLPDKAVDALKNLKWPGRLEILCENPFVILDASINKESAKQVVSVLNHLDIKKVVAIVAIPDDKDYAGVVHTISPVAAPVFLTKSSNEHYVFTKKQEILLKEKGYNVQWADNLSEALNMAKAQGLPIIILGTTSLISDIHKPKIERN